VPVRSIVDLFAHLWLKSHLPCRSGSKVDTNASVLGRLDDSGGNAKLAPGVGNLAGGENLFQGTDFAP
jgi:hypothetical protein